MILVSYDLYAPGQSYERVTGAIQALGPSLRCLRSVWLVDTNLSPQQANDYILQHTDQNDRLLVVEMNPYTSRGWLDQEIWDWIQTPSGYRR